MPMEIIDKNTPKQPFSKGKLPMRDMSHSLPMALLMAREAVMFRFRSMLHKFDITEQQWRILRTLAEVTQAEVVELARSCFILQPSVSRILKNLEERGFVFRRTSPDDRRCFYISLTAKGTEIFKEIAPRAEEIYNEIEQDFGQEKTEKLLEMLNEIYTNLKT